MLTLFSALKAAQADIRFLAAAALPPRTADGPRYAPKIPEDRFVELRGRGNALVRTAAGPAGALPVVLLHGWTWTADLTWAETYEPLSWSHPVIAPDLRFHGRGLRDGDRFRLADATDDVIELLDLLGVERAVLAGFSLGGVVAVDAAARHPDRVAGIVVGSAAACYTDLPRDRAVWRTLRLMRPAAARGFQLDLSARYFNHSYRSCPELNERWGWVREELARTSLTDMLIAADGIRRVDLRPQLANGIACPAEYLLCTRDRVCRPSLQRDFAQQIGARVTAVDADHDLPIVDPRGFAELFIGAIARLRAVSSGSAEPTT
jgi:pimeloyl-ACP methyl ester carboxylesterase